MGDLDQISKAIGSLESSVKTLSDTQKAIWGEINKSNEETRKEIKELRDDIVGQKISGARSGGRMGVITAVATFGVMEGVRYYLKHHGGA